MNAKSLNPRTWRKSARAAAWGVACGLTVWVATGCADRGGGTDHVAASGNTAPSTADTSASTAAEVVSALPSSAPLPARAVSLPLASQPVPRVPALEALRQAVGTPRCTADAQCHTLAAGARACGGPSHFVVWSDQTAQRARLQPLADAVTAQEREADAKAGRMSICTVLRDPGAHCNTAQGVCEAGATGR